MLTIGGDIGHKNAKIVFGKTKEDRIIYKSTIKEGVNDLLDTQESIIIEYDRKIYTIGSTRGAYSVEDDKSKDDNYKLCLISGVAMIMTRDVENINLVTGLPINYYKRFKDSLERSLDGQSIRVRYKNCDKVMNFANVKVFPESAGLPILYKNSFRGAHLVIDIGGRTVDVSYFEDGEIKDTGSYDLGMLTAYGQITKHINNNYGTDYSPLDAERIIKEGSITADNEEIGFDSTRFLRNHTNELLNPIKLDFPWKTSKKTFIGGGSIDLAQWLPKSCIQSNGIYSNAEIFYEIGVDQFGC